MTKAKPPVDVDELLDAAAKPEARKPDPFICTDKPALAVARNWLIADEEAKAQKALLGLFRVKLIQKLKAWHHQQCVERGELEPSLLLETTKGTARLTFQDRYEKIREAQIAKIQELAGQTFATWFQRGFDVGLKKDVANDRDKLEAAVIAISQALGAEEFVKIFEVEKPLCPTEAFTLARLDMAPELLAAFEEAGVIQIAALARAK